MGKFEDSLKILGGKNYKIFTQKISEYNTSDFITVDIFGLLIEKQKRKVIPKYGVVDGFAGNFLTKYNENTGDTAIFLIKDFDKKEVYQLENEYTTGNNNGMISLLQDYNHASYLIKQVADLIPDFITNYYIEQESRNYGVFDEYGNLE